MLTTRADRWLSAEKINKQLILSLSEDSYNTMVDLGGFDGSLSLAVKNKVGAKEAWAVDVEDKRGLNVARKRGLKTLKANLNKPLDKFKDNYFDLVIANQVIEHLCFTDRFIKEIYRILKPGGDLIISTTNLAAWHYRVMLLVGMQPVCLHPSHTQFGNFLKGQSNPYLGHKSVFTHTALVQFIQHHGFVIRHQQTILLQPFPEIIGKYILKIFPNLGTYSTVKARKPK